MSALEHSLYQQTTTIMYKLFGSSVSQSFVDAVTKRVTELPAFKKGFSEQEICDAIEAETVKRIESFRNK